MTDIILERSWDPPLTDAGMRSLAEIRHDCFRLHRVTWVGSMLSTDGSALVCRFHAHDAESARIALQKIGADISGLWPGTVHDAPGRPAESGNVAVTRRFAAPVEFADVQAAENRAADCLAMHRVRFLRSFLSSDRRRMICVYGAPDAESVRTAQREARMPVDSVWSFRHYAPAGT